jgi:threonine dehydrogenase-like Zn-dependent dehydrogenase
MKAIAIHPERREVGVIDAPDPALRTSHDVKVKILEVGVCGTDREICAFEYGTPPPGEPHLILGHESLAEIVEVGAEVPGLSVGDLVVPMVRRPCHHDACLPCSDARQDCCTTGEFTERGIRQAHGFMAELVVEDARYVIRVPRALADVAVLVEPLTIAEKAMAQLWTIQARLPWLAGGAQGGHSRGRGKRALVLGAGPVGLLGAMKLAAEGFDTFVYARAQGPNARTALVQRIGATYVSGETTSLGELARRLGNIDVVFEATGASRAAFDALPHLGTNGAFLLTGVPGRKGALELDADGLMRNLVLKNQLVLGTVNASKRDFETAVADLAVFEQRWPGAVAALITGRHRPEAARALLVSAPAGIKDVVRFAA